MILLCGIPTEPPLAMVQSELEALGVAHAVVQQRRFAQTPLALELVDGQVIGHLTIEGRYIDVRDVHGAYPRLMDWRLLPDLGTDPAVREACRRWHDALTVWLDIAPFCVMNRTGPMASNQSKPYQSQLIREVGFAVPETLVTNDPEAARAFFATRGPAIYKSISSTRSIVQRVDAAALERLPLIRWCPVQFQEFIAGLNVRVHVVGDRIFATRIDTDAVDYRYAARAGRAACLEPYTLADDVAQRCIGLARKLSLPLAGIDLIITVDDEVYCLEVNPSPAFSFFERNTGQPIARAIAETLAGDAALA